jgi:hypothetical protein
MDSAEMVLRNHPAKAVMDIVRRHVTLALWREECDECDSDTRARLRAYKKGATKDPR